MTQALSLFGNCLFLVALLATLNGCVIAPQMKIKDEFIDCVATTLKEDTLTPAEKESLIGGCHELYEIRRMAEPQ